MITTDHQKQRKDLRREKDLALQQIFSLQQRLKEIDFELANIEKVIDERELVVTDHAIERFKQRVIDIPAKIIRQKLTSNDLLTAFRKRGEGKYSLTDIPHVVVVIKDFTVLTVINTADYEERLKTLRFYMDYFIDELATKYTSDEIVKPMKFKKFNSLYWRNETGKNIAA